MSNITDHFTWDEATYSPTARRMGINNLVPNDQVRDNILRTAKVMEDVRTLLQKPIKINSWYRSPMLNVAIGGARNSAHMRGLAVDWEPVGMPLMEAFNLVRDSKLIFDQLIHEGTRDGASWIHLGLSEGLPRNEVLMATGDRLGGKMNFRRLTSG